MRIDYINESAELLSALEWPKLKLVLQQHGFWALNERGYDSKYEYVVDSISESTDDSLLELHKYSIAGIDRGVNLHTPYKSDRLHVFASHLSLHREFVGKIKVSLARYGIDLFVAHQSIGVSKEWQQVIEAALSDSHAMVAFLHDDFQQSPWCDQEVGWIMGLRRPLMVVGFGNNPHGFAGKFQALNGQNMTPDQIGLEIFSWAWNQSTLRAPLVEGLVESFCNSRSFDATRSLIPFLERAEYVSDEQLSRIELAARSNSQLREANIANQSVPEWVQQFVENRRSSGSTGWETSYPF